MEQHPVPRNISSFEFHLVGDMTLRQFAYVAGGVIIAYILTKALPFPGIIKYTFAAIVALVGCAFAFLPIQERPLDRWLVAFIKSVYSPTQFLWKKEGLPPDVLTLPYAIQTTAGQKQIETHKDAQKKLHAYLATLPTPPHQTLNLREQNYINKTLSYFNSSAVINQPFTSKPTLPPSVSLPVSLKPVIPEPTFRPVPSPHQDLPPQPIVIPAAIPSSMNEDYLALKKQLEALVKEKELLAKELTSLREVKRDINAPSIVKPSPAAEIKKPTITTVTPKSAVNEVGMQNLDQYPNIVTGVVKDGQKRQLPNVILTLKDAKGLPLRAIKTNKLGQFATATPLPNGVYLLEAEDPLKRYVFDIAEITLSGKVFLPIEIIAKGERELMREKLSKELFGSASI